MSRLFLDKIKRELPALMRRHSIDLWVTLTREYTPDPMADLLGLDKVTRAAAVFARDRDGVRALALGSRLDHALLNESGLFDEVLFPTRTFAKEIAALAKRFGAQAVAVNMGEASLADGLSHTQFQQISRALWDEGIEQPASSFEIIFSLRSRKSEEELAALREAATLSHRMILDALPPAVLRPGETTERDVADFLLGRAADAGLLPSWDPAYCPIVSFGETREHAAPSPDIVLEPGHLVIVDFGVRVDGYGGDLQRCAYVPRLGETGPPEEVRRLFDTCLAGIDLGLSEARPGVRAGDVDQRVRTLVREAGYPDYPNATGHPIGLVVHELGPAIAPIGEGRPLSARELEAGQVFTMEPSVYLSDEAPNRIRVGLEEDFVVTDSGVEVLSPRQTELIVL